MGKILLLSFHLFYGKKDHYGQHQNTLHLVTVLEPFGGQYFCALPPAPSPSPSFTPRSCTNIRSHSSFCFRFSWQRATWKQGLQGEWWRQSRAEVGVEWSSHESWLSVLNGGTIWDSECEGQLWAHRGGCTDSYTVSVRKEMEWEDGALTSRCSCGGRTPARCPSPWERRPNKGCASGLLGLVGGLYWRHHWTSDPVLRAQLKETECAHHIFHKHKKLSAANAFLILYLRTNRTAFSVCLLIT